MDSLAMQWLFYSGKQIMAHGPLVLSFVCRVVMFRHLFSVLPATFLRENCGEGGVGGGGRGYNLLYSTQTRELDI